MNSSKEERFKVKTALSIERQTMIERHTLEMKQFKNTDEEENPRQETLKQRRVRRLNREGVRLRQENDHQELMNNQNYDMMTREEQRRTVQILSKEQKTERKRLNNEISRSKDWKTSLANTTRPYASKHEMNKYKQMQRKRK